MPAIRQQIDIATGPRAVWRAFTTAEGLTAWWVDEARVEPRTGGRVVLVSEGDDGEPVEERGMFLEFKPTRKLEIAWDNTGKAPTKGSRILVNINRAGEDTRVSVVHSGADVEEGDLHESLTKGWKAALGALRDSLEG
jgi:uncharacterized protein YndB with AHSA1/START domain